MKYIVVRIKDTLHVAERRTVGLEGRDPAEVYESIGTANSVQDADLIVTRLNSDSPRMVEIPDEPDHYVTFDERGWFLTHSVECRRSGRMEECRFHEAISEVYNDDGQTPEEHGRWKITHIDAEGLPSLERAG